MFSFFLVLETKHELFLCLTMRTFHLYFKVNIIQSFAIKFHFPLKCNPHFLFIIDLLVFPVFSGSELYEWNHQNLCVVISGSKVKRNTIVLRMLDLCLQQYFVFYRFNTFSVIKYWSLLTTRE